MECTACGAFCQKRSAICPECGAKQSELALPSPPEPEKNQAKTESPKPKSRKKARTRSTTSLIEFPGIARNNIPEWRKELGDRVREVQKKRAQEATLEVAEIDNEALDKNAAPLLELLPQADLPEMNPIVVAALRRIEKANVPSTFGGNMAVAVAYDDQSKSEQNLMVEETTLSSTLPDETDLTLPEEPTAPEKVHNLAVVPTAPIIEKPARPVATKPKRLIRDDHDPALNYLDTITTQIVVDSPAYRSASIFSRMAAAVVDLIIIGALAGIPFVLTTSTEFQWSDPKTLGFAAGAMIVVSFFYLTINTAMTGRTPGMRLFSLRVVDARTGLIPTGGQSAGRAIVYLVSLAPAGIVLLYPLVNPERQTVHDRFTKTVVVHT